MFPAAGVGSLSSPSPALLDGGVAPAIPVLPLQSHSSGLAVMVAVSAVFVIVVAEGQASSPASSRRAGGVFLTGCVVSGFLLGPSTLPGMFGGGVALAALLVSSQSHFPEVAGRMSVAPGSVTVDGTGQPGFCAMTRAAG